MKDLNYENPYENVYNKRRDTASSEKKYSDGYIT